MRIQHVAQAAKGWPDASAEDRKASARLSETIERIHWRLWHGQVSRGLDLIGETMATLEATTASPATSAALKVARRLGELETYANREPRPRGNEACSNGVAGATGWLKARSTG